MLPNAVSGESIVSLSLVTDPHYYLSNANNNFSFFCEYTAPSGNVSLVFPDSPCAAFASFEGYSGELSFIIELQVADLYQLFTGETFDVSLITFGLLGQSNALSGEYGTSSLSTSAIFAPLAIAGEYGTVSTITLPPRAELSSDNYTGENIEFSLATAFNLELFAYAGSDSNLSLNLNQYADYIVTEGPAAYWKMDEQSGTKATDYTGNNTAADYTNGPVLANLSPVASKFAVYFDGANDLIIGNPNVTSNDLTQELWVKPDAGATITLYTPANTGTQGVIGQRYAIYPFNNGTGSGGGISIGSNGIQVVAQGNSYLPILLSYQQAISTSSFTHVLVSWSNRTPTLYINGIAVATGYQARSPFQSQGLPSSGLYGYYKGYMQDVAIYPSALTAEQAREHYLAGLGLHFIPRFEPLPAYTGELLDTEFTIDLTSLSFINNFNGEYTQIFLENNVRFYSDAYSGSTASFNDNSLDVIPNSTFTYFYGGNSHTETQSCITLQSLVYNIGGINAGFYLPSSLDLQSISELNVRFKRTRPSTWSDDDFSDAGLIFWFFPNYLTNEILYLTASWTYSLPAATNPQAFGISFRHNPANPIRVYWNETSSVQRTGNLTVNSNFTTNELNGTDSTRINIVTGSSGTTVTVYGGDDTTIRQSGTFASMPNIWTNARSTTNDIFLVHYHNYQSSKPEILCDIKVFEYEGIVLSSFIGFGTIQGYADETALVDDLYTSVIFELPAISGELETLTLSTYPSIDLGIVTYYADERLSFSLITSSVIDAPGYAGENYLINFTVFPSTGLGTFQANSGERYYLDLSTFSILSFNSIGGETSLIDLTFNIPDLFDSIAYSGESSIVTLATGFALECIARAGSNGIAVLDIHPAIPLSIQAYSGEYTSPILLVTAGVLEPIGYSGELNSITFTTFIGEALTLPFYAGSRGDTSLATVYQLSAQAYADQYSDASLTVFYPTVLVITSYSDEYSTATLRTQDALNPRAYSDHYSVASLTTSPAIPISGIAGAGSSGSLDILLGITFPSIAYDGARLFFDLTYVVNPGMPLPIYSGDSVLADIATTYNLPLDGRSGEYGRVDLGVEYAMEFNGRSGEYGRADLTLNPPDEFVGTAYSGEYLPTLVLSTRFTIPSIGYSGEILLTEVTDNPAAPLLLLGYAGVSGIVSMQTALQIPIGRHYSGEWANVIGMTNEPHWYMVTGCDCIANLSTSVTLPFDAYEGQNGIASVFTRPSESLGIFYFSSGEWMSPGLEVLYSANFRILYRTSIMTQVDIRSATYFDLTTDLCCGERPESNNLIIIMERGMYPEEVGYGDRVYMTVDLQTLSRMKVEFPTGHVAELIDKTDYFDITFAHESHQIELEWEADLRHRLCKGYFIPTGNWVVVELQDVLPEDCYADRFYGGESAVCELSDDIVLRVQENSAGETCKASIELVTIWQFVGYTGERMIIELPMEMQSYKGERFSLSFYEPPIRIYSGSTLEFELQTAYGVRFLEDGCLDNEFVYQNDSGDLIPELFNPTPVEGEPYTHSVKAECF